ncbi:MAG: hypothetical protein NWR54_10775, partial [Paracoccaceae bacterium]|nr:hypothetical protein [Paracoccaceae bacterium]
LGALRGQMVDPLRHLGIEVEWSTQTLLDYGMMEPKALMDTVRIIQEAIHNAVVRGGCTDLTLVSRKSDDIYTVTISNWGGQSFSEENRKGLGIINMTERAEKIGGKLSIEPLQSGAILTLALPPGKGMAR